jgi:Flp pilus assembly protein TadB
VTVVAWAIGAAWGLLAAVPVLRVGHRRAVRARIARPLRTTGAVIRSRRWCTGAARRIAPMVTPVAAIVGAVLRRRRARIVDAAVARELPVALDLLGVAVDAGCTPFLAVEATARWGPPGVAGACERVGRACGLGTPFAEALGDAVTTVPRLGPLADALLVSDRLGAPAAPALARLASSERADLRRAAEAHARRVPVRLLFPLVFLVLPAFVLLTVVPGLAAGLADL